MNALCNSCKQEIYEVNGEIREGAVVDSSTFKSLEPDTYQDPENGMVMNCPKCGEFWPVLKNGGLYVKTTEGVKP